MLQYVLVLKTLVMELPPHRGAQMDQGESDSEDESMIIDQEVGECVCVKFVMILAMRQRGCRFSCTII